MNVEVQKKREFVAIDVSKRLKAKKERKTREGV